MGDEAFPLRILMMKPHGHAILTNDKLYFNYRNSQGRLVTEGAFRRLKIRFKVLFLKCESNKETAKLFGLTYIIIHNLYIEGGDLVPRNLDLTLDHLSNKSRSPEKVRDALALQRANQRNFEVNKKPQTFKVRKALNVKM